MVNTDYTFNGKPISESFVIEAAEVEGLSVDEYVNQKDGLETVEVTDEIQTTPAEGKTNGAAAEGATATPVTGQAPESTELEPDDILSGLEEIKDVREIDKRIDKITSTKATKFFEAGEISPLDSPKRIAQYKELINRRNNIIGDAYKLGQTQTYQQKDFDPMSPSKKVIEREGAPEGGAKLAYVPFTVDGEVVGTTMEPLAFEEVVVTAEQYKERERQIQSEAYINFLEQSGLSTEPLSREEFEAKKEKEGDITEIKTTPYKGLDLLQSFENIGAYLSGLQQTAQEKEDFRNQYEDYLSFMKDEKVDVKREVPRFLPSIGATVSNTLLQIGGTDDRALLNLAYLTNSISSDTYRNIFGVNIGDKLKEQAVKGLGAIDTKINYLNSLTGDVAQFTDIPDVEGVKKATSGLAATLNAISSFGATVATAIPTSGYSIYSDMIANNIKSFNDAKAQRLGIDVTELANQGETEILIPATLGTIGAQLEKFGIKGIGRAISKMSPGAMQTVFALFNSGIPESATEWSQTQLETYNEALGRGLTNNEAVDLVVKEMTSKQSIESFLQGFAGGGGTVLSSSLIKSASNLRTPSENKRVSNLINKLNELENSKYRKNLNADDIAQINTAQEEIRVNLRDIVLSNNELVGSLTPAQIQQVDIASDYLTSSTSRINEIKASDKYSEQDKENIIASINEKRKIASALIYDVRNEAEKLEAQVFTIKDLSKFVKGVKVEEAKDDAEALKFVDENNLEIKASTEQGYILQNPETGEQTIVINKETAQNQQAVNVAAHEFLHALLYSTIKNNPKAATNLGRSLMAELNKIDVDQIEDSDFKKRMQQYADKPLEEQMEEAITLFSDALVTGDIKFKENIATRIGDKFRRLSQKFGVKIKFNTGRDVYNFVKDYNKSIKKGELSIAQVRAAAEGVEGELVTPATEQKADEQIIKESRSEEASNRVQEIYDEQGEAGAFDIIEQFKPITSRIVERRSEAPGFDRQLLTDEIETGQRGIIDLIKEYDPESGVPLAAYINKFLPARAIEASKRVLGEEFTEDVTEARGVAAEEVVTETPTKPEAKAIDPFRIMPDVKETATAEVQKSIADKDIDVTEVTYKELKDAAPYQTVADFFNIPVSRIKNPKDNLRKSDDVANIQRWILKNEPTLKNLFTEANREVVEIKEGNRVIRKGGEPTAIPRNLLNKFYKKGARVGNNFQWTLKPYDRATFLEAVGIKDGKVDPNFTPRAAEAQTIKGILDMYTRNLGNVIARETIEAREDIAPAEKARAKAEVAKGKPRLMFSKEVDGALTQSQSQNIGKVFNKLNDQEKITFVQNIDPFFEAITKDDYNVETAFNNIFGPDFLKGKKKQDFINEWSKVRGSIVDLKNYNKGKPKKITVQDYLYQAFEEQTQEEVVENILGIKKGGVNFRSKDQLMGYVNFINSYIAKKAESLTDFELAEFIINDLGPTLSAGAKVGGNDFMWQRDNETGLLSLVPSTLDRSKSIRTSLFGNQKEMAEVLIRPFISNQTKLTYEGNKPLWDGKPLLKKGYKVDQSVSTYLTSIKKNGEITPALLKKSEEYAAKQVENIFDILDYYKSLPKDSEVTIDNLGMFFRAANGDMTAMVRAAANVDSFAGDGTGAYRYEHNPPARTMLVRMAEYVNGTITRQELKSEFDKYTVSIIPQQMDDVINERYKDTVPLVGSRYYNAFTYGRFPFAMNVYKKQSDGSYKKETIGEYQKEAYKSQTKASNENNNKGPTSIKFSKEVPNQETLDNLGNADQAMANARNADAPVKKIRVFDFDDTLARSNSQVLYEMPDGTTGKLNATQFAERAGELEAQGAEFDFSEFSKVVDGKRGPVFKAIENIVKARGAEDVFILTARPADAAGPIKEFMDALGVNIPIENIVGLGDGKAEAKARWMTGKAAEGYNDFFFVDDAYKNVKAVQDALDVFDVKSKTQQAKVKFSKKVDLDKGFNDILEQTTGIASEKEYKRVKAEVAGASRGIAVRGIPYSAQDFVGLLYETLSKGKLGDAQMAWYKKHLFDPYSRAVNDIDNARLAMMNDYKMLKKQLGLVPKNLRKKIPGEPFTNEQAVRVYIWNKQGMEVPGISKSDLKDLSDYVENNAELQVFADQLVAIQKGDQYAKPKEGWPAGSITTDLLESINTVKRAKYLEQWQNNVDVIFSEKNMNKLEAAYGKKYRKAMENMLGRMKTGRNRSFSDDSLTGRFTDWLQGSIGTIMFFNTRSAILQTISSINFVNFTDNNPLAAAKAFANQKQYWSDFVTLINSDFLKARRSGLRMNVNEADIADMAKKGGPRAVINKLLQLGFAPTQIADSFAIASGGATFYRNRINTYKKQGLSQQEAETKAFEDFRENAEESQQSARPDRISMQQAGPLGRHILSFQNTPSQYARIIDKSVRDLKNNRGDAKTNISKIVYYSTAQNLLFNALQQALFAFAFGDEEPEDKEKEEKYVNIANGMMDSLLRGTGIGGGILSVGKNAILRIVRESEKARPNYEKVGADLLKIAPPVSSKLSKINQAARSYKWDKKEMKEKGWSLDNPAYLAGANVISALTNVPLDRGIKKANNVVNATDSDLETWERLALLGGWQDWEIGIDKETKTNKPQPRKVKKKKVKKKKIKR